MHALAQRNALIGQIRSGRASSGALLPWNQQLATHGIGLMFDRAAAADSISESFTRLAGVLGLGGDCSLTYRPRSRATTREELAQELAERVPGDLERGFTGHGPHRDD